MKIKLFDGIALSKLLCSINLALVGDLSKKIVDVCMTIDPFIVEYNRALEKLRQDAADKTQEEVENLVSAQAFKKTAEKEIDLGVSFSKEEADTIITNLFTVSGSQNTERNAADYMMIHKLISNKQEDE